MLRRITAFAAALALSAGNLTAYSLIGSKWTATPITMHLQFGANAAPLSDGFASWTASAEDALARWNTALNGAPFAVVRNSTVAKASGNLLNNVFFSPDV